MKSKQYTNLDFWRKMSLSEKGRQNFPLLYYKCTGLEIEPGWEDPPGIISVGRTQLIWLRRFNFKSDTELNPKWKNSDIVIPLLYKYRRIGGFLLAYRHLNSLQWVKYTYRPEVDEETPLIAISGVSGVNNIAFVVDTPNGFLKLINWYHCQKKYTFTKQNYLIIYIDQGEPDAMKLIQRCQLRFKTLIDLTEIGIKDQLKDYKAPYWNEQLSIQVRSYNRHTYLPVGYSCKLGLTG